MSKTILYLLLCWLLFAGCQEKQSLSYLTTEEQEWLKQHGDSIRVAQDPSYPPLDFLAQNGDIVGISNDYLSLFEEKLNIQFIRLHEKTLEDNLIAASKGKVDIVTSIAQTPQRSEFLIFTDAYFESPAVIIVKSQNNGTSTLKDLTEKKITVANRYAVHDYLENHYPELKLNLVSDDLEGLKKLAFGETDVLIADLASVSYYLEKSGISNLHVAGNTGFVYQIAIGIRKDLPVLHRILNKTLSEVSQAERNRIRKRWVFLSTREFWERENFWYWTILLLVIILGTGLYFLTWNRSLRKQVLIRTRELKKELDYRLMAEQSLRESEQRYRIVAGQQGQIVYDYHLESGKILWFGDVENTVGYSPEEMALIDIKGWEEHIHPDDLRVTEGTLGRAISQRTDYEATYRFRHKEGHYIPILDNGTFLEDKSGKPYRMLGIMRDITIQKKREDQLREAKINAEKADQLKTQFLANMSHEVRTPMNGIVGFASLLTQDNLPYEKQVKYSHLIQQSSQHLQKIIDDILDISMIESSQIKINLQPVSLNRIIDNLIQNISTDPRMFNKPVAIKQELALPDGEDILITDELRLQQVLGNLMNNAIKFTTEGHIMVKYSCKDPDFIVVEVSDTGIGVPPDQQKVIFERFRQSRSSDSKTYGGTGLGLSISQGLIQLLGGEIWCETNEYAGTTFRFTLPWKRE